MRLLSAHYTLILRRGRKYQMFRIAVEHGDRRYTWQVREPRWGGWSDATSAPSLNRALSAARTYCRTLAGLDPDKET